MKTFLCVLLVCCVTGMSSGMDLSAKIASFRSKNQEVMAKLREKTESAIQSLTEGVKEIEEDVNEFFRKIADVQNVCQKDGSNISCCANDLMKNYLCLGLNVNTANFSVEITFSVNGKKFIDDTISGKNPPPICGALPQLPILKLCVEPYDLSYSDDTFNVCLSLAGRIINKDIARVNLSCLQISKDGSITPVKPTSSPAGKSIININTSKLNPMLNKTVNPLSQVKNIFRKKEE